MSRLERVVKGGEERRVERSRGARRGAVGAEGRRCEGKERGGNWKVKTLGA